MLCYYCMRDKGDSELCPYCHRQETGATQPHHICPGTVIGQHYIIGHVLGEGGFGITYIGFDNTLNMPVAIKEYYPYGFSNRIASIENTVSVISEDKKEFYEKGLSRFLNEARTLAKFRQEPGIVDVRGYVEENNTAYIIMEYLDGITLREYLNQQRFIEPEQAVEMLLPVMRSLGKIHEANVIHRDISPDNIMMLRDGSLKLMDFGAARDYYDEKRSMSVMLKKGYAPWEQYSRNGVQGPWTDVYAICATLYRCITGEPPVDSIERIDQDTLRRPSEMGIKISPALESVLLHGMAVHPKNRYQNMRTLIECLKQALSGIEPGFNPNINPGADNRYAADGDELRDAYKTLPVSDDDSQFNREYAENKRQAQQQNGGQWQQQNGGQWQQQDGGQQQRQKNNPQHKNSFAPIIVSVCLVAIVLIGGIIAILALKDKSSANPVVSTSASSATIAPADDVNALEMPDLIGKDATKAVDVLAEMNLTPEFQKIESDSVKPGQVVNQVPKEGTSVTPDTKITLYIAEEKPTQEPTKATEKSNTNSGNSTNSSILYCTANTYVTLHKTANVNSQDLRKIWSGQQVQYISASQDWYYVKAGSVTGYAAAEYLSPNFSGAKSGDKLYAKVDDFLSLRTSASDSAGEIIKIPPGASMTFLGSVIDNGGKRTDGYNVQWVRVSYNGYVGYVYDFYVKD